MECTRSRTTGHRNARRFVSALACVAGAVCAGAAANAAPATATGVMNVSAIVNSTCIVGASALTFTAGTSAAIQAGPVDSTGNVTVDCTKGTTYTVALDKGAGIGATMPIRVMTAAAVPLNYSVFALPARAVVWGDGTASTVTVAGTGTGSAQSLPAYGRIFGGQTIPAGTYTDIINVTVTY